MFSHAGSLRLAFAFAVAVGAPDAALAANEGALSEARALQLGLNRPEFTELAAGHRSEAAAELDAARLPANPTLELQREKRGPGSESSWQISQPLDLSGRRGLRRSAAEQRLAAADADNLGRRGERAAELRLAFYRLLLRQRAVDATAAWAQRFERIATVVDKLATAGEASGYDRRRLARERQTALLRLAELRAELERDRARLAALTGDELADGVAGELLPAPPAELVQLQAQLARRPEQLALAARAAAAEAESAAAAERLPEITVGIGSKSVDDGFSRERATLLSLSLPLPLFDQRQAGARRSAAQAQSARAELALAQQQAAGELRGRQRQLLLLLEAASRFRREAVAPSTELVRIAEAAYRGGESTVLELLDAYRGALEAETTALELEWKAREARIELDQLTGSEVQ